MLSDQRHHGPENRRHNNDGGHLELERGKEGKQPDLNRLKLKIGGDHINHPGGDDRADDEFGSFDERGHSRLQVSIVAGSARIVKSAPRLLR
jgi:hypothetical protein